MADWFFDDFLFDLFGNDDSSDFYESPDDMDSMSGYSYNDDFNPRIEMRLRADQNERIEAATEKQPAVVLSLTEQAARVVGRQYECHILECHNPPLDDILLKKVAFWAFPQCIEEQRSIARLVCKENDWDMGEEILMDDKVEEMWQVGFMATAYIRGGIRVSLTFEKQQVTSATCSRCERLLWCPHIVASVAYRIKYHNKVKVHAPMTESLSVLSQDQLRKLIQYAVEEDPAAILNGIFKRYNIVRDSESSMAKTEGAPDPTFIGSEALGSDLYWTRLLAKITTDFHSDMMRITELNEYYPTGYFNKEKAPMYRYIQRLTALGQDKESHPHAVKIFTKLFELIIEDLISHRYRRFQKYRGMASFCRDLEYLLCCFIVHPTMDSTCRQAFIQCARQLRRQAKPIHLVSVGLSKWVTMPSLIRVRDCSEHGNDANMPMLREAKKITAQATWPPELLQILQSEENTYNVPCPEDLRVSMYRLEAMYRFKKIQYRNSEARATAELQRVRLTFWVLCKLIVEAREYLVLGKYFKNHFKMPKKGASPVLQTMYELLSGQVDNAPPPSTTSSPLTSEPQGNKQGCDMEVQELNVPKRRKRKSANDASMLVGTRRSKRARRHTSRALSAKVPSTSEEKLTPTVPEGAPLTQGLSSCSPSTSSCDIPGSPTRKVLNFPKEQLAFCIIKIVDQMKSLIGWSSDSNPGAKCFGDYLPWFIMIGLELCRLRTLPQGTEAIAPGEHEKLRRLETEISSYLTSYNVTSKDRALLPLKTYFEAFLTDNCKFYGGEFPLLLIDTLLTMNQSMLTSQSLEKKASKLDLKQLGVQVCALFMTHNQDPFAAFALPKEPVFPRSSIHLSYVDRLNFSNPDKSFLESRFRMIIDSFLSLVDVQKPDNLKLFLRVLHQLEKCKEPRMLLLLLQGLRLHMVKLMSFDHKQAALNIVLRVVRLTRDMTEIDMDRIHNVMNFNFLSRLILDIGPTCLIQLIGMWHYMMSCDQLTEVLLQMDGLQPEFDPKGIQSTLHELIKDCLKQKNQHGPKSVKLMNFFDQDSASYQEVLSLIKDNFNHFTHEVLLQLARVEELTKSEMTETVFQLTSMGLKVMKSQRHSYRGDNLRPDVFANETRDYFEWFCKKCVAGGTGTKVGKSKAFKQFCKVLTEDAYHFPFILVQALNEVREVKGLLTHSSSITKKLTDSFLSFYDFWLTGASHFVYPTVIEDMVKAQEICANYRKDGLKLFKAEVVTQLKNSHAQKRKFCNLADAKFSVVKT